MFSILWASFRCTIAIHIHIIRDTFFHYSYSQLLTDLPKYTKNLRLVFLDSVDSAHCPFLSENYAGHHTLCCPHTKKSTGSGLWMAFVDLFCPPLVLLPVKREWHSSVCVCVCMCVYCLTSFPCMLPTYLNSGMPTVCWWGLTPKANTHSCWPERHAEQTEPSGAKSYSLCCSHLLNWTWCALGDKNM